MKTYKPQPFTFDRVVRILITVGFIIGFLWLINYLSGVLVPFVIAVLLAYVIHPLVDFFQNRLRMPRGFAILSSLVSIIGTIVLLGWIFIPIINQEFIEMGEVLSIYLKNQNAQQYIPEDLVEQVRTVAGQEEVRAILEKADYTAIFKKVYPKVSEVFTGSVNLIMSLFSILIIILYLVFILADYEKVMVDWKGLIPPNYREYLVQLVEDLRKGMNQYFRAQALVAVLVGILFSIGFEIIGLPLAIILGLFIGALNMVPYMQTIGAIPAIMLGVLHSIKTDTNLGIVLGLIALIFVVVQIIQEAVLIPRIMGKVTGLSPVIILLSLSIWGALLGILGLLIALPITTLLQSYYTNYLKQMEIREKTEE
ncbi:MAG: AI-2E family transporter [Cytophagales bacterium]|nr:AI-2E family transporter [Cytophagales bacterium]